ncbi:MAG: metal ABC transporter permease [Gammaproteobacteria bacterium]|nr:metal ABC transporter permease [Gammaproteobacteria bacterium]
MEFFLEPFGFEFFRNGVWAALMVGTLCGLIGVFIVLRGMSYIGHGLSHAAFGGAVLGYVINLNFYVGAGIAGFLAAVLINQLAKGNKIKSDAAIGIVTTAFFALGVALISRVRQFTKSFDAALFGNILGVTTVDLIIIGVVLILTVLAVFFLYKPLLFSTFDNEAAKVFGIRTELIQLVFSLLLAMSIIASMNVVGVTMIAATLVIPASTARLLTDSFSRMLIISAGVGAFMGVAGMFSSYQFDAASGATIVLCGAFIFCVVLLFTYVREKIDTHQHMHRHGGVAHSHPHHHDGEHEHTHSGHTHKEPDTHSHEHPHGTEYHSHEKEKGPAK